MSYSSPAVAVVSLECNFDEVAEDTAGELDICAALTAGDLAIDITVNFDVICGGACGKRMTRFCGKNSRYISKSLFNAQQEKLIRCMCVCSNESGCEAHSIVAGTPLHN